MNDPKVTQLIVDILDTDCHTVMRGVRQSADQLIIQLLTLEEVEAQVCGYWFLSGRGFFPFEKSFTFEVVIADTGRSLRVRNHPTV